MCIFRSSLTCLIRKVIIQEWHCHRSKMSGPVFARTRELCLDLAEKAQQKKLITENFIKDAAHVFGPSLSLNYKNPLIIVQGQAQSLIDHKGQFYLDCVNNVAHVGHSHPSVSKALSNQSYVLNTNTRYLNNINIEYAERLCDLFPEPLNSCFLVCSGSEANELGPATCLYFQRRKGRYCT